MSETQTGATESLTFSFAERSGITIGVQALGTKPYILLEVNDVSEGNEFNIGFEVGGGIRLTDTEGVADFLGMVTDAFTENVEQISQQFKSDEESK